MAPSENGWNEYSRLVLEQLETLSVGIDAVRDEMLAIKQELAIMKAKEDRIRDIKAWKEKKQLKLWLCLSTAFFLIILLLEGFFRGIKQ